MKQTFMFFVLSIIGIVNAFCQNINSDINVYRTRSNTQWSSSYFSEEEEFTISNFSNNSISIFFIYAFPLPSGNMLYYNQDFHTLEPFEEYTFCINNNNEAVGINFGNKNEWLISISYKNNGDGKDYVKKVKTNRNSFNTATPLEEYGNSTGISLISNKVNGSGNCYYSTCGIKLKNPQKGIIILNHKKIILKEGANK